MVKTIDDAAALIYNGNEIVIEHYFDGFDLLHCVTLKILEVQNDRAGVCIEDTAGDGETITVMSLSRLAENIFNAREVVNKFITEKEG